MSKKRVPPKDAHPEKRARTNVKPQDKAPRGLEESNRFYNKKPSWCFAICDFEHDKWGLCEGRCVADIKDVLSKLKSIESRTWADILSDGKGRGKGSKNHPIEITQLTKEAQSRLREINIYHEELYSVRLQGAERIWGVVQSGVFSLLWHDPDHEICPSLKKHT